MYITYVGVFVYMYMASKYNNKTTYSIVLSPDLTPPEESAGCHQTLSRRWDLGTRLPTEKITITFMPVIGIPGPTLSLATIMF